MSSKAFRHRFNSFQKGSNLVPHIEMPKKGAGAKASKKPVEDATGGEGSEESCKITTENPHIDEQIAKKTTAKRGKKGKAEQAGEGDQLGEAEEAAPTRKGRSGGIGTEPLQKTAAKKRGAIPADEPAAPLKKSRAAKEHQEDTAHVNGVDEKGDVQPEELHENGADEVPKKEEVPQKKGRKARHNPPISPEEELEELEPKEEPRRKGKGKKIPTAVEQSDTVPLGDEAGGGKKSGRKRTPTPQPQPSVDVESKEEETAPKKEKAGARKGKKKAGGVASQKVEEHSDEKEPDTPLDPEQVEAVMIEEETEIVAPAPSQKKGRGKKAPVAVAVAVAAPLDPEQIEVAAVMIEEEELVAPAPPQKKGKGRKAPVPAVLSAEEEEETVDKPVKKIRGKKAVQKTPEPELEPVKEKESAVEKQEEVPIPPTKKSRGKGAAKAEEKPEVPKEKRKARGGKKAEELKQIEAQPVEEETSPEKEKPQKKKKK